MPSFFVMLPEVKGLSGLDIGCGEGHKPGCLQTLAQLKVDLPNSKIPIFTRTIIQWLNLLIKTGFALERI